MIDRVRLRMQTTALHTEVMPAHAVIAGALCRVCGSTLAVGGPVRRRQWGVEYAHEACGWLRDDEHEPHECRRPGTTFAFYEWRCPSCGLDACDVRKPDGETERRCIRCAPQRVAVRVGGRVEPLVAFWVKVGTKKHTLRRGEVGRVVDVHNPPTVARVEWPSIGRPAVVPVDALTVVP